MKAVETRISRLMLVATVAAMAACGGGGDNADPPAPTPTPTPAPARYSVGGTLDVVENIAVDSDTNDILQTPFLRNDTLATAQSISASAQIMGHANRAFTGPSIGRNYSGGDVSDFFQVTVAAGQTVELDFIADNTANDLDLYIYNAAGAVVGFSNGVSRSECVSITTAGTYRVEVEAFAGASIYNLRVTAPGAASSCANATSANAGGLIAGELIVATPAASLRAARAATALSTAGLRVLQGTAAPGSASLVALPDDALTRRKALAALGGTTRADSAIAADEATQRLKDTVAYAKQLRASGAFEYVLYNRTLQTTALTGTYPPNDPRYPLQRWHYEQIALPAAMNTLAAMNPQPTVRPIVAVIDTGLVTDHPDFVGQTVPGFDFISNATNAGDGGGIDSNPDDLRSGDSQPSFHGTHVAGTVGAATFDNAGAAGVAPMALIMPIRVLGVGGSGSFYDIVQGIRFAAKLSNDAPAGNQPAKRADVINLSLGADGVACDADTATLFSQVRAQGSIIVVATGNNANRPTATSPVGYPANCAGAIAVSSTDPRRGISYFSNTGSQVAIAAPGGDMRFSTTGTGLADGVFSTVATFSGTTRVPSYGPLQGTSMATPHVAGVMALMRWVNPNITPAQVDTLLAQGALTDEAGAAGKDSDYGWGIVNASKAVQAAIASLGGGGGPPAAGIVEATPTALDFGTSATALEFTLRTTGTTTERVTAVASNRAGITVAATSVDANGLGVYRVTVDRSVLAVGVTTGTVTATTTARTIPIAITLEKRSVSTVANAGPIYVLVIDNATGNVLDQANLQPSNGRYTWSLANVPGGDVLIVAGSDYDNDNIICSRGEVCGAFPVFGANLTPLRLDRNRNDLNFLLAPLGAGNAGAAGAGEANSGQKRKPTPTLASNGSILKVPASAPKE